jgi:hypothetical protein
MWWELKTNIVQKDGNQVGSPDFVKITVENLPGFACAFSFISLW